MLSAVLYSALRQETVRRLKEYTAVQILDDPGDPEIVCDRKR